MYHFSQLCGINNVILCFDKEKFQDKLEKCRTALVNSAALVLEQDTLLLDSFHSATIEGARTTIENVKKSLSAPEKKSDKMVVNHMKALNMIYSGYRISENTLRDLWEVIVDGVCENEHLKGRKYRIGDVYVSSYHKIVHTPAPYESIETYMRSLFVFLDTSEEDPIIKAIAAHFYFVYIHPYCDGNGRTARILQNYLLFGAGYPGVRKIRISQAINLHLNAYYKALELAERPVIEGQKILLDLTVFIEYMLDRMLEACNMAEKKQYSLTEQEKLLLKKMSKRGIGAEITEETAAGMLKLEKQEAGALLEQLSEKGFLLKGKADETETLLYRLLQLVSD